MPVAFRSKAWLPDRDNKLKPKVFSASNASGGVRKPLPSWTVSPFSATAASRLVKITSPFSSPLITGTTVGAVARISERIIDCPVKVIVIGVDCAPTAAPMAHTIANRTATHASFADDRSFFDIVVICPALAFPFALGLQASTLECELQRAWASVSGVSRELGRHGGIALSPGSAGYYTRSHAW